MPVQIFDNYLILIYKKHGPILMNAKIYNQMLQTRATVLQKFNQWTMCFRSLMSSEKSKCWQSKLMRAAMYTSLSISVLHSELNAGYQGTPASRTWERATITKQVTLKPWATVVKLSEETEKEKRNFITPRCLCYASWFSNVATNSKTSLNTT